MTRNQKRLSGALFAAGAMFFTLPAMGGAVENMLKLNGSFQGVSDGAETAPGWTIAKGRTGAVCSQISVGSDGVRTLELRATDQESVGAFTPLFAVSGNVLEVECEVQGIGSGSNLGYGEYIIGYQGFDGAKKHIIGADGLQTGPLYPVSRKVQCYLPLREGVKYFRVCLVARPGATAKFRNLFVWLNTDASQGAVPAQPSNPAIPLPPANSGATARSAATSAPAPMASAAKPAAPVTLNDLPFLLTDNRYSNDELKPAYQIAVPLGDRINVELEEDSSCNSTWNIHSYGNDVCRVRIEHARFGVANLRRDTAKISLEGLKQGNTNVILLHSSGKKLTIRFMVR